MFGRGFESRRFHSQEIEECCKPLKVATVDDFQGFDLFVIYL